MEIYFVQPIVEFSFDFHQSFAFAFYNEEWDASFLNLRVYYSVAELAGILQPASTDTKNQKSFLP